jgi:error-prone DNA polymerase
LCQQAAQRRYRGDHQRVQRRLREEFDLIRQRNLAGFLLMYHDIIQLAREVMIDLGLTDREIPLEERPPGRGRGSSVAMLVGYLIGLSHIDPLEFNLSLERFLPEGADSVPDIDLDFPRNIREELIRRVHQEWGWDRAALTAMIATYQMKGAIRGLGKALGLPQPDVDHLAKRLESHRAGELSLEMAVLPEFKDRVDAPVWRDLIDLADQLAQVNLRTLKLCLFKTHRGNNQRIIGYLHAANLPGRGTTNNAGVRIKLLNGFNLSRFPQDGGGPKYKNQLGGLHGVPGK